jgi:nucleoside-diphosphate-sugar epimerase
VFLPLLCCLQRAIEMCKEARGRWKLCTINPGAIWGPPLSHRVDGESVRQCLHLLSGVMWPFAANIGMGMVDVRDVARAHIAAMENPEASGRYLVNSKCCYLLSEARRWLRKKYPKQWVPPLLGPVFGVLIFGPFMGLPQDLARAMLNKAPEIDASRAAKDLDMTPESYIGPEQCVMDMAEALFAKGMVPRFSTPVMPFVTLCAVLVIGVVSLAVLLLLRLAGFSLV